MSAFFQVGVRKKMLDTIRDLHRGEWTKTALPKITAVDKQKGIYLSCPDCIVMASNMAEHVKLIGATLEYMGK